MIDLAKNMPDNLHRNWLFDEIQKAAKEECSPPPRGINPNRWKALVKSYRHGNLKKDNHQDETSLIDD